MAAKHSSDGASNGNQAVGTTSEETPTAAQTSTISRGTRPLRPNVFRGLRFRLTAIYSIFFALLISLLGGFFRQNLESTLTSQVRDDLDQDWAAIKGYLRIEGPSSQGPSIHWYFDRNDPDEAAIVERLRSVYILADDQGKTLQISTTYQGLNPPETPQNIREALKNYKPVLTERIDAHGTPYLVRAGYINDEYNRRYYLAIGRSLRHNRDILRSFTLLCLGLIPVIIIGGCVLGWASAGRALTPVLEVARTAQSISGSNLSLRIPGRNAGDELDYLIETFNEMIERLEISFRQVRQFSTDVSHELRTPITIIRGQLEVALLTAKTSEQYRDAIVECLQDIERLSAIVRALLLLSQSETGQIVLQKSPLDLTEVFRDIAEQFEIPADAAGVRLVIETPDEPCICEVDRVQIERMLSNLLSNAVKFTPLGGDLAARLIAHEDDAELVIDDTGPGIPAEHLPFIFDRFYRVDGPRSGASPERGLGLGLSFVAWIVKAHAGTIQVDSQPGRGTKFTVRIPRRGKPLMVAPPELRAAG